MNLLAIILGCFEIYQSTRGSFNSPNYPLNYPSRQNCYYRILSPDRSIVTLSFLFFSLRSSAGCFSDWIQVSWLVCVIMIFCFISMALLIVVNYRSAFFDIDLYIWLCLLLLYNLAWSQNNLYRRIGKFPFSIHSYLMKIVSVALSLTISKTFESRICMTLTWTFRMD